MGGEFRQSMSGRTHGTIDPGGVSAGRNLPCFPVYLPRCHFEPSVFHIDSLSRVLRVFLLDFELVPLGT